MPIGEGIEGSRRIIKQTGAGVGLTIFGTGVYVYAIPLHFKG